MDCSVETNDFDRQNQTQINNLPIGLLSQSQIIVNPKSKPK